MLFYKLKKHYVEAINDGRFSFKIPATLFSLGALFGVPMHVYQDVEEDLSSRAAVTAPAEKARFAEEVEALVSLRQNVLQASMSDSKVLDNAKLRTRILIDQIGFNVHISEADAEKIARDLSQRMEYKMPPSVSMAFKEGFLEDCRAIVTKEIKRPLQLEDMNRIYACTDRANNLNEREAALSSGFSGIITMIGLTAIFGFAAPKLRDRFEEELGEEEKRLRIAAAKVACDRLEEVLLPKR